MHKPARLVVEYTYAIPNNTKKTKNRNILFIVYPPDSEVV